MAAQLRESGGSLRAIDRIRVAMHCKQVPAIITSPYKKDITCECLQYAERESGQLETHQN